MTIYETAMIRPILRWVALVGYRLAGWSTEGQRPAMAKCVIIAAPHTSNWDFITTLCLAMIYRLKPIIMMKDTWFQWPLGTLFRWLGAMPIDRSRKNNMVVQCVNAFHTSTAMMLVVPPSGTRKRVMYWKTGFYHIASGAGVPIVLGFVDYKRKIGGFGPTITPTGDIGADMADIRGFYRNISGKYPLKESCQEILPQTPPTG